MPYDVK